LSETSDTKKKRRAAAARAAAPATAEQVAAFLEANQDFLLNHPNLIAKLIPPTRYDGNDVVDMQRFMVDRLQTEVEKLNSHQTELIATTRSNMSSQAQIHAAVLAILDAQDREHLVHAVTQTVAQILDIDVTSICMEQPSEPDAVIGYGVYVVEPGAINGLLGQGRDILLREATPEQDIIFGPAAALVKSDALVRLNIEPVASAALLALGSREVSRFHPGQGTELLSFLAQALERCIAICWSSKPT
jgi:hypothetical protein